MEKKKKIWAEPKLTALVRRKLEEGILQTCKHTGIDGPTAVDNACHYTETGCGACSANGPS